MTELRSPVQIHKWISLTSILYQLEDEAHQKQAGLSLEERIAGMSPEEERKLFELLLKKLPSIE